jgi:hypothetical protein
LPPGVKFVSPFPAKVADAVDFYPNNWSGEHPVAPDLASLPAEAPSLPPADITEKQFEDLTKKQLQLQAQKQQLQQQKIDTQAIDEAAAVQLPSSGTISSTSNGGTGTGTGVGSKGSNTSGGPNNAEKPIAPHTIVPTFKNIIEAPPPLPQIHDMNDPLEVQSQLQLHESAAHPTSTASSSSSTSSAYVLSSHANVILHNRTVAKQVALQHSGKASGHNESDLVAATRSLTLLTGLLTVGLGLFRAGFITSVFARPVMIGMVWAIAVMMVIGQIPTLLGLPQCLSCPPNETPVDKLYRISQNIQYLHTSSSVVGLTTCAYLFSFRTLMAKTNSAVVINIPFVFIAVIFAIFISWYVSHLSSIQLSDILIRSHLLA